VNAARKGRKTSGRKQLGFDEHADSRRQIDKDPRTKVYCVTPNKSPNKPPIQRK
jgi:hypothetical protein